MFSDSGFGYSRVWQETVVVRVMRRELDGDDLAIGLATVAASRVLVTQELGPRYTSHRSDLLELGSVCWAGFPLGPGFFFCFLLLVCLVYDYLQVLSIF